MVKVYRSFVKGPCKNEDLNVREAKDLGKVDTFPALLSLIIKELVNVFVWVVFEVSLDRFEFYFVRMTAPLNLNEEASLHGIEAEGYPVNDCKYQNCNTRSDVASSNVVIVHTNVVATILEEVEQPVN